MTAMGWFSDTEWNALRHAVEVAPAGPCVEVGTYRGRSATALLVPGRQVILIDPLVRLTDDFADPDVCRRELEELVGGSPNTIFIQAPGKALAWNHPIAVLHVDDAHTDEVTGDTLRRFGPHVIPGGFLCMHDWSLVRPIWERAGLEDFEDAGQHELLKIWRRKA